MKSIILATTSPRRKELFERLRIPFTVQEADYLEDHTLDPEPRQLCRKLAEGKAMVVAEKNPDALVIAADTLGVIDGRLLTKAKDLADERRMIKMMSGRTHSCLTGLVLLHRASGKKVTRVIETKVTLRKLTDEEIDGYIKSRDGEGKAGAFAIQGLGAILVEKIEGDYYNVMGFPLCELTLALKEFGIRVL